MTQLVLFGTGSTAMALHYYLQQAGHEVLAFCLDRTYLQASEFMGCPLLPFESLPDYYPPDRVELMIAIGYAEVNQVRAARYHQAQQMGYRLFSYLSPNALIWQGLQAGDHCKIGEQTILQPYSQLGENVFIGSGCIIGHHSLIGDHCFLASGVKLGGQVTIDPYCFVGTGAVIRNKVTLAERTVIGAGAVVTQNTTAGGIYLAPAAEKMPLDSSQLFGCE